MIRFKNNQKGMTLVEVIAAAAIMGIAFAALISLFTMSTGTVGQTGQKTQMMLMAQDLMEHSTKIEGFHMLADTGGGTLPPEWTDRMNEAYGSRYSASRTVDRLSQHLIKITVKVYDLQQPGNGVETTLVTLLSDYR